MFTRERTVHLELTLVFKGVEMKSLERISVVALVGLALLAGSAWQFAGAQVSRDVARQRWEYKKLRTDSETNLNELGAEGWELVAIASSNETNTVHFSVFKRPAR